MSLTTKRLVLRRWRRSDKEPFARLNADPLVMEHFPDVLTREESDAFADRIETQFNHLGFGLWAVEVPGEASFIGFVGLSVPTFDAPFMPAVEIGWRLDHAYWSRGFATEAALAAMSDGFERVGLDEIVSFTSPANVRSTRVMERLAMSRNPGDDFDHPRLPEGHPLRRHVLYRLSRTIWLAVRQASTAERSDVLLSLHDINAYEEKLSKHTIGPLHSLTGLIELSDYDPAWPDLYHSEAARIRLALGGRVQRIEHVGSTSVPGLPAKPIVDIVLVVPDSGDESAYVPDMEAAGYVLRVREAAWFQHRMFNSGHVNAHVHTFSVGCPEVDRMVLFRDWLRRDIRDRELYANIKNSLAKVPWKYVQQYADAKTAIVDEIMARAEAAAT